MQDKFDSQDFSVASPSAIFHFAVICLANMFRCSTNEEFTVFHKNDI